MELLTFDSLAKSCNLTKQDIAEMSIEEIEKIEIMIRCHNLEIAYQQART
jgi:hypothetical protein